MPISNPTTSEARGSGGLRESVTVTAGTSTIISSSGGPCVVTASPGSGGSMLVEASWSSLASVQAGTATWFPWDHGTIKAKDSQWLDKATAIRFTATTQDGVGEVAM